MEKYALAPWDKAVKFFTWSTIFIFIFLYILLWPGTDIWTHAIFIITFLLFGTIYIFGPRSYIVDENGILINRLVGSITIPYKEILNVEKVEQMENLIRLLGNGGFFSYYGTFMNENNVKVKVYATNSRQMVKITTKKMIYYLSPRDPEAFVREIKKNVNK